VVKKLIRLAFAAALLFAPAVALAQSQVNAGFFWGNPNAGKAPLQPASTTQMFDRALSSTRGSIIERGAGGWVAIPPSATARAPFTSQGTGADPAYAGFSLPATLNSGGVACFSSTTTMISSSALTANAIMLGGGAGVCPTNLGSLGTTTTVLHGNAAGLPTFGGVSLTADVTGTLPIANGGTGTTAYATGAQYLAGTVANVPIAPSIIFQSETVTTFGSTTTFDFSTFINTAVTLTGNITTQTLTNTKAGQAGSIRFIQDGTGSRTTVWNSPFKFQGGVAPTLSTAANAVDILNYNCVQTNFCPAVLIKDVR